MTEHPHSSHERNDILESYIFTAGPKQTHAKETPYGKWIRNVNATTKQLFEDAQKGYLEIDDEQNREGQYARAYQKALDAARRGNYEGLMHILLNAVNISPAEQENMVFDDQPTPAEAEKIFMEMGRKQYPELEKAEFSEIVDLWKKTRMGDVPKEFLPPQNRNIREALPALRSYLQLMMLWSSNVMHPQAGPDGVKLCYAMMMLERRLSESMKEILHPDMTMWERLAIDEERKKLS